MHIRKWRPIAPSRIQAPPLTLLPTATKDDTVKHFAVAALGAACHLCGKRGDDLIVYMGSPHHLRCIRKVFRSFGEVGSVAVSTDD